jgi:hypothetical protein
VAFLNRIFLRIFGFEALANFAPPQHADKPVLVESRFHIADGQGTKKLVVSIEDISVMRIGVDRHDILDRNKLGDAVTLDRQVYCEATGRSTGAAERSERPSTELRSIRMNIGL